MFCELILNFETIMIYGRLPSLYRHFFWERFIAEMNGRTHQSQAGIRDAVTPCTWHFVDQAVSPEQLEQTPHTTTLAAFLLGILAWFELQVFGDIAGIKAPGDMLSTQDRQE